ncbi:RNA polymerase subunit sigma-24 [Mycobacterium antarcticum]|uniref:RNA polymerase sigma factor n=1 Tax=unclassified Mycolicibacterium TaxID=2636767 RepID=UPI00238D333E|nr:MULTISPECIES: sigma-70 family RNA polymerase sigma factor [unclassified Mycolicibacterium]BDX34402.1 RNA polymerase subunit sigma-24 [Mycolicibacterium sp. TUM20985]GLP77609.1 RNA polymerase subunit sigma-24 [Mycolicibacterium sp. TUM20983]
MTEAQRLVAETIRTEGARILATLVRIVGDLQAAEDAVQEAAIRALRQWPVTGIPDSPRAWLTVTARRAAIDALRREQSRVHKERAAVDLDIADDPSEHVVRDDMLRLMFTCAHPALALDAQVTLALRVLCGLSTAQISTVLLTSEAAIAKRLTRTRTKIAQAGIPYQIPTSAELSQRLSAVCAVLLAAYTSAHTASAGDRLVDVDGCQESLRLARLVCSLMPDEATPMAVLSLLLLTEARRPARTDADGAPVVLADQDRTAWDTDAIDEGRRLLNRSLSRTAGIADPYQLQAAIAAEHAISPSYQKTDWVEIVRLYDLLLEVHPTSAAALARAVAVAENSGTAAGLVALDDMPGGRRDHRWHAVRGELMARCGRYSEAIEEVGLSLTDEVSAPEAAHRRRQIDEWTRVTP